MSVSKLSSNPSQPSTPTPVSTPSPASPSASSLTLQSASGPLPFRMTNDYLFKALLQENESVLRAIVCALLHLDPEGVGELEITNPIILGDRVEDKDVILDVNVRFSDGASLDLEMQVASQEYWRSRSLYYAFRNQESLKTGEEYTRLRPTIHVGFLDFQLFEDRPIFSDTCKLMSIRTSSL